MYVSSNSKKVFKTYSAKSFLSASINQYGVSGNGIIANVNKIAGIIETKAVFLHDKKYPTTHTNHVPKAMKNAGKTVRLLLIFGWTVSDI